jgi:aspartate-semialdehyde dehydrogenase
LFNVAAIRGKSPRALLVCIFTARLRNVKERSVTETFRVGILGATGTVGQRFLQLLDGHPQFRVTAVAASDRSLGRPYAEACRWRLPGEVPAAVRDLPLEPPEPPLDCDVVFSSLPAEVAGPVEARFAAAGYPVISNSSAHRMDDAVPLLIPEVNPEHLALLDRARGAGFIVTNPNCSTIMVALALAPLAARFGIEAVAVTTLQALSGAGYPGVASLDITDNVVPFIAHEEDKIERETRKILGRLDGGRVAPAAFAVSAQCHRVNVVDGHLAAVRVKLARAAAPEELREAFAAFTGLPQALRLPTAPERPIVVRDEPDRPQPRLDRDAGRGMSVTVGRIARDAVLGARFVVLGHNTIRGAAGAALLNAELLAAQGYLAA